MNESNVTLSQKIDDIIKSNTKLEIAKIFIDINGVNLFVPVPLSWINNNADYSPSKAIVKKTVIIDDEICLFCRSNQEFTVSEIYNYLLSLIGSSADVLINSPIPVKLIKYTKKLYITHQANFVHKNKSTYGLSLPGKFDPRIYDKAMIADLGVLVVSSVNEFHKQMVSIQKLWDASIAEVDQKTEY